MLAGHNETLYTNSSMNKLFFVLTELIVLSHLALKNESVRKCTLSLAEELQNFLKILDIEESQYIKQIEHRYYVYRYWLDAEIRHRLATRASQTTNKDAASNQSDEDEAVEV